MTNSERRFKVLMIVISFKEQNDGNTPKLRELSAALGWSINMTHRALADLIASGAVERCPGGLRVIGGQWRIVIDKR